MKLFFRHTCITWTTYSTMLYLMTCKNRKDVEDTLFILDKSPVGKDLYEGLPHVKPFCFVRDEWPLHTRIKRWIYIKIRFSLTLLFSKLYVMDFMPGASIYIGFKKYRLLEDAPGVYSRLEHNKNDLFADRSEKSLWWYIKAYLFYGPVWHRPMGRTSFCIDRIITDPKDSDTSLIRGKKYSVIDLRNAWDTKDNKYKQWLLGLFDVTIEDLTYWKQFSTIILTQPWLNDCKDLSETEFVECYRPEIEQYEQEGVLIKPHPRDEFDWEKAFPKATVMKTKFPMQFLCFMGVIPKRVITMSSSAVDIFPQQTEIIKLGHKRSPAICAYLGEKCN